MSISIMFYYRFSMILLIKALLSTKIKILPIIRELPVNRLRNIAFQ